MAVPAANKVFLMEPETGEIVRSIPGPGSTPRTHGMAVENNFLWVINSDDRAIFKLDTKNGTVVSKIQLGKEDPVPHGLDIDRNGILWYCDAGTGWVCKLV
jgi:streptogramin lyase